MKRHLALLLGAAALALAVMAAGDGGRNAQDRAACSSSRSAPNRPTTTATRRPRSRSSTRCGRTTTRCSSSTRAKYPAIKGDLAESWTVAKDGLTYTFKLQEGRQVPRRLDVLLGGHQGDLRAAAQPAAGRALDPAGELRRHRLDRDARPADRGVQAEEAERLHAHQLREPLGLRLQRRQAEAGPEVPRAQHHGHRARSPSPSTSRARTGPGASSTAISRRASPTSTATSRSSSRARRW